MSEIRAKVFRSAKRVFDCQIHETKEIVSATAMRDLIKGKEHIVVGDEVVLKQADQNEGYEIIEVRGRTSEVYRKIVRENKKKVIAANVDLILIVSAVSKPEYKPGLIDRYLLRSVQWNLPVVLIFNKMDEFDDQFNLDFECAKFEALKVTTYCVSALTGTDEEFNPIRKMLKGKTAILLGQSGVGKSKLITKLVRNKIVLPSEKLAKVGKGAHTTSWTEIVDCETFDCIDSPGIRSLSVNDISIEELPSLFPDIEKYFSRCKFNNCQHDENSKGCYFHSLDEEKFEDLILIERVESYVRIRNEVEAIPEWEK